jgi:hypothetical protein
MGTPAPATPALSFSTHWYSKIVNFLKHAEVFVSGTLIRLFGSDVAHNFAAGAEALLKSDLGKIAIVAVQEAQNLATGSDKMAVALGMVLSEASKQGLDMKESLARMLIELAVARLKNVFGAAPTS